MVKHRLIVSAIAIILGGVVGCGGGGPKRLPEAGFQVEFQSHKVASEMISGKTVAADITFKNISPVTWPSKPDNNNRNAVNLSYHWLNRKGETLVLDGLRTPLPRDLKPGESINLKAAIQAPAKPGRYILEVTLVQEGEAWFPDRNGAKLALPVNVTEGGEIIANAGATSSVSTPASAVTQAKKTQAAEKAAKPQVEAKSAEKSPLKKSPAGQAAAKTDKPARSDEGGRGPWSVQLGSYAEKKVAANLAGKLKDKGYDAYVTAVTVKGRELHRVRVGHLQQRAEAEKLRETLRTAEKLERGVVSR